ncbi:MAG: HlyD family efflux transporter periplasmic adaptor subunit [Campylobacterota bacterium]|nr:HlyD family efflux transporter periplasmic adaptor subunit [Campylobacterota bacterium]
MKKFSLFLLMSALLLAKVHYAKVEPYESVVLKSAVSAQVTEVDLGAEGKMIGNKEVIHLDDTLDQIDLVASKKSLELLRTILGINQEMVSSLADTLKRQKGYYERINKLATASKTQKDTAFSSFVSAKNQYLSTKEKIETLKNQILDMQYKIARLKDSIDKKSIRLKQRYLYKLVVRKGDFVNPGSPLATIQDHNRAKLTLFLEPSELKEIRKKHVFIDGRETRFKVDKVWNVADEKFISSYRVEIYIDTPQNHFSKLVKVELK